MRLYCVPFAGAGASFYGPWRRKLAASVDVRPVQLPAREELWNVPHPGDVAACARMIADAVLSGPPGPYFLFGHSMGALLAFEAARLLAVTPSGEPAALLVSAFPAPRVFVPRLTVEAIGGGREKELRLLLGPAYSSMAADPELFAYVLGMLRADVLMCERYRYREGKALACPISAFGAENDGICPKEDLREWASETSGAFECRFFRGDHFYLRSDETFMTALVGAMGRRR
jgi:surfactin synthase thioesterase subunit